MEERDAVWTIGLSPGLLKEEDVDGVEGWCGATGGGVDDLVVIDLGVRKEEMRRVRKDTLLDAHHEQLPGVVDAGLAPGESGIYLLLCERDVRSVESLRVVNLSVVNLSVVRSVVSLRVVKK